MFWVSVKRYLFDWGIQRTINGLQKECNEVNDQRFNHAHARIEAIERMLKK